MQNLTDLGIQIKEQLIEKIDELLAYITTAVEEANPAHEVESDLWLRMIGFGNDMMGAYLNSIGDGDQGEWVTLPNGHQVKRLDKRHIKKYLTVFGEYEIPRVESLSRTLFYFFLYRAYEKNIPKKFTFSTGSTLRFTRRARVSN